MASRGDININDVQPKLFDGWEKINIEETLEKSGSFTKLKSKDYFDEGKFPVVDQGDKFISGFVNDENLLYKGELPIIIFGDHTRNVKYIDFPFATGADGTKVLKPKPFYNPNFYHYYFKSLKVPNLGYSRHFAILKEIDFPLPPLAEQNRIVAKLDTLFAQLETIKTSMVNIPLLLKDFRQQVLTQAVTGKLTEEWRKGKGIKQLSLIELSHFCKDSFYGPRFSKDDYTSEGFPTVRTTDMSNDGKIILSDNIPRIKIDDPKKIELYKVKKGDLLITRTGSIGKMARYFEEEIVIPSAYLIRFRFNELAITDYIYYCLTSSYGQNLMGLNSVAVTQPNLNAQKIKTIKIPNITIEEQQEIISCVERLFAKAEIIEQQYQSLKQKIDTLPQALLHKAFKGQLTEQLDSDGDARELLQQIQELKKNTTKPKKAMTKKAKNYPEGDGVLGMVAEGKE